jgi:hypothetical protein
MMLACCKEAGLLSLLVRLARFIRLLRSVLFSQLQTVEVGR